MKEETPADPEMLAFMRRQPAHEYLKMMMMMDSPSSKIPDRPNGVSECRAIAVWNHSIAVGLLHASFEICKLRALIMKVKN